MQNYLLVILAYLFIFLLIRAILFVVIKLFSPAAILFLQNTEWLDIQSAEAVRLIILSLIYCIMLLLTAAFFYKTRIGLRLMLWFININKKIGLDVSREAINKRIDRIGEKKPRKQSEQYRTDRDAKTKRCPPDS